MGHEQLTNPPVLLAYAAVQHQLDRASRAGRHLTEWAGPLKRRHHLAMYG
ncbi:MAG TPA: hypothetical protein VKF14_10880 [Candidatus Dormibacteraeota bacterium]|nr:hypothetical protein [Candidatus Dormibacteraeota bacterium]